MNQNKIEIWERKGKERHWKKFKVGWGREKGKAK